MNQLTEAQRDAITAAALDYCRVHGEPGDEAWNHYKMLWSACNPKPVDSGRRRTEECFLSEQQYRDFVRMLAWWKSPAGQCAPNPKPVAREVHVIYDPSAPNQDTIIGGPHNSSWPITRVLVDGEQVWPKP